MAGKVVDFLKTAALNNIISTYLESGQLFLFTNNFTIAHDTVLSDLTPAAWTGYSNQYMSSWTSPAYQSGDGSMRTQADMVTFNGDSGSDQTYYGWGMIANGGTDLICAYNYGSPQTILAGGTLNMLPVFRDLSQS